MDAARVSLGVRAGVFLGEGASCCVWARRLSDGYWRGAGGGAVVLVGASQRALRAVWRAQLPIARGGLRYALYIRRPRRG